MGVVGIFTIVAKSSEQNYSALFAVQTYPLENDTLIRVIDVVVKIVYPPVNGIYYQQRCYGWFNLDTVDHTSLDAYVEAHPEIQDLDTREKYIQWYRIHPEAHEPPVDRRNTLAGLYEEYPQLKSMTSEQKSEFFRELREKKRALYAERIARNRKV